MIRVTCPNCGSKLNAKNELAGQTRKCPKCAQPIQIVADAPADTDVVGLDEHPSDQHVQVDREERLPVLDVPERLNRDNHYLICDRATWWPVGRTTAMAGCSKPPPVSSVRSGTATICPRKATLSSSN